MASGDHREPWFSTSVSSFIELHVRGKTFQLNKKNLMWRKSGRLSKLVNDKSQRGQQLTTCCLPDIPGDVNTFTLALDFCDGHEPDLTPANVVPLACIASYLEMSEAQSPNNLFNLCLSFLHHRVLPHWNSSLQAIRSCERVLPQALALGLVDSCVGSIAAKAVADPSLLLGNPLVATAKANARVQGPSAKRVLFPLPPPAPAATSSIGYVTREDAEEELINLSLPLFELAVSAMFRLGITSDHAANCLLRYTRKHPRKEVMETVERLLPLDHSNHTSSNKVGGEALPVPCKTLSELLRCAIQVQASQACRKGLEGRMSKQLHEASVEDLLIPCHGYSKETRYDVACVIRMLKDFYGNYSCPDSTGLVHVMELVTAYLSHVAGDPYLRKEMFMPLVGMVAFTLAELNCCTDSVYSAIDIYLSAQRHLTESEKEQVCQMLDVHLMSSSALGHAAQNDRLPLRVVVQVLFVCQFRLQEAIAEGLPDPNHGESARKEEVVAEGRRGKVAQDAMAGRSERESGNVGKTEMEGGGVSVAVREVGLGGKKANLWKDLKRKFGCKSVDFRKANKSEYYRIRKHPRNV